MVDSNSELLWIRRVVVLLQLATGILGWGKDGRYAICKIAEVYFKAVINGRLPQEPYQLKVTYDKLVIAAGAEHLTFDSEGVQYHAFSLREVNHTREIRKNILLNLTLSESLGISEEENKCL